MKRSKKTTKLTKFGLRKLPNCSMSAVVLLRKLSHVHPTAAVILTTTKNAQLLSLSLSNKFTENRRKMSGFLIDEPKYAFLKELGIEKRNHGVFNGTWGGSGDVSHSFFICLHFYRAVKWEMQGNLLTRECD